MEKATVVWEREEEGNISERKVLEETQTSRESGAEDQVRVRKMSRTSESLDKPSC